MACQRFRSRLTLEDGPVCGGRLTLGSGLTSLAIFDKMIKIISLQKSDGSWELDRHFLNNLRINVDLERGNAIVATALAIAFLQVRMAPEAEALEHVVEKARRWLSQQHGVDADKEISDAQKLV
ncbi:hypothetical protein F4782DRAFT_131488 [Xylaria castorea]|nr:hypothetical protein F4782DRAFT_131488 [Xylaria castorea]